MRPDFDEIEHNRIRVMLKAVGARYGLIQVRGVSTAATLPGARVLIEIDPVTGHPIEPDLDAIIYPGDLPNSGGVLS